MDGDQITGLVQYTYVGVCAILVKLTILKKSEMADYCACCYKKFRLKNE